MGWDRATVKAVALRTGYPVSEAWSSRNQGTMGTVYGPMLHHTGTSQYASGDYPTLAIVRDGRSDLPNSLCMYGLGRSGRIYCVSEKVSWHAGAGSYNGVTDGNGHFAGIEAEGPYSGTWPAAQVDAYERLVASILLRTGRNTSWMPRHANWAPSRKVDVGGINMTDFTNTVKWYLANPNYINRNYEPAAPIVWTPTDYPLPDGHMFSAERNNPLRRWGQWKAERVHIKRIQQRLITGGHVSGISSSTSDWADGVFGSETSEAVLRFKERAGMPSNAVVGPGTWARMSI